MTKSNLFRPSHSQLASPTPCANVFCRIALAARRALVLASQQSAQVKQPSMSRNRTTFNFDVHVQGQNNLASLERYNPTSCFEFGPAIRNNVLANCPQCTVKVMRNVDGIAVLMSVRKCRGQYMYPPANRINPPHFLSILCLNRTCGCNLLHLPRQGGAVRI
jgi:hypothetical protein